MQDVCPKFCDNQSTVLKYEIGKPRQKHAERDRQRERERDHIDHIRLLYFNPLNAELNPICHTLALLGAHHIFHVSVLRVNFKEQIKYRTKREKKGKNAGKKERKKGRKTERKEERKKENIYCLVPLF